MAEELQTLYFRSDGLSETPSGLFAVHMIVASGTRGDRRFFRFAPSLTASPVEVEWDAESDFALFPQKTALALIERGYGVPISAEIVEAYNASLRKAPSKRGTAPTPAASSDPQPSPRKSQKPAQTASQPESDAASPPPWG